MKKFWKKLISMTLALTIMVSATGVGTSVYAASDKQEYEAVTNMHSLIKDANYIRIRNT